MVVTMTSEWVVIKYTIEVLNDVRDRLQAGAEGPGAALSADECTKVLACLKDPPNPKHAPPKKGAGIRQTFIALHCFKLEDAGTPVKVAVADTMRFFGCSRSAVYEARKVLNQPSK
jgi:hypothetical protein